MSQNAKKRILFDSIIVTGANILDNAVFFIINMMAARYLSLDHYGEYMTATGCATFVIAFCDVGINQNFIRAVSSGILSIPRVTGTVIVLKSALTICTYGALSAGLAFSGYPHAAVIMTLIFGGVRLCSDYLKTFFDYFDARRLFRLSTLCKSAFSILLLSVSAAAVYYDRGMYSLFTYRLAAALVMIVIVLSVILITAKRRPEFSGSFTISFLKESIPFGISSTLSNAYQRVGIILLSIIQGTAVSGIYSNAILFFTSLLFLPKSVSRVLLPLLYRIDNGRIDLFQKALDTYGRIMAIGGYYIALVFFLFGDRLINILFGDKYADSVPLLRIVSLGIPFIFTVSDSIMIALERQKDKVRIEVAAFLVMIASSAILVPILSATGAVISIIGTYIFLYAAYHLYLKFKLGMSLKCVFRVNKVLCAISAGGIIIFEPLIHHFEFRSGPVLVSVYFALMVFFFVLSRNDIASLHAIVFKSGKGAPEKQAEKTIQEPSRT